ncbi:hypothetical protein [Pectobacterium brasiliense]|uniref:hypothetical protein n=1 Tax=Pectobacterium brasiliense TaxID=180957 RepID=UPI0019699270|nr:hypothetical protein [Pectobacterium brasiliense]MBN3263019.1 hypothetical protein [Pectobacterium brasiliense]
MATDVSKLRKSKGLGSPPGPNEVATNLGSPEVAPAPIESQATAQTNTAGMTHGRRDGRSARKTNRTQAFATRVTPEFDIEVRDIADRENAKLVEVLERALQAYKEKMGY